MAKRKIDHSHINTPQIEAYCKSNGLKYAWKNEAQGHMIVQSVEVEAYVWVQRMRVMVRMRNGVPLSKPDSVQMSNTIFNAADFTKLLGINGKSKKRKVKRPPPLVPRAQYSRQPGVLGVVVVRIPKDTPPAKAEEARQKARSMAQQISKRHERDHYYERGW